MCRMRACYIALVPRACSCILVDISVHHVHVASIYQGPLAPLCVVVNSAMIMNDKMTTVHIQAAVFILGMVRRHKSWRYVCACTLGPRRTGPAQRCSYSCGYSLRPQIASISGRIALQLKFKRCGYSRRAGRPGRKKFWTHFRLSLWREVLLRMRSVNCHGNVDELTPCTIRVCTVCACGCR